MFELMKSVILAGGYKLADIHHKIKKFFLMGDLTESQMDELFSMASGGVSADAERPEMLVLIKAISAEVEALKVRVATLENGNEYVPGESEQPTFTVWKPWNGISNDYQKGAIVSHNGELWISEHPGQNVWEPGAAGTDSLWVKHIPEE